MTIKLDEQYLQNTGCLRKKHSVVDINILMVRQLCNIFRHNKYNCHLVVCEISTPYVKRNKTYELGKNARSNRIYTIKWQIYICAFGILNRTLHTPRWKMKFPSVKISHWCTAPFIKYFNFLHHTFFEIPSKC